VIEAFAWGFLAAASLIIGGVVALRVKISKLALGLVMAFGAGVLISAVAYDLVLDSYTTSAGSGGVGLGLLAGALTFFAGDWAIDYYGGKDRKSSSGAQETGSALAITLGIVLDGIPESVVLGLSLLEGEGISVSVLAAVFLSNLPESIAATTGLSAGGWRPERIIALWLGVAVVSGTASAAGYALLDGASAGTIAFVNAFAAGAILTMLADTMMPEAFSHGGRLVGLATTLGFMTAFLITNLD
jgi:zinc transporter, ZIP family